METMLADGRLVEKLQELNKRDKGIFKKIADYFKKLAEKIRAVYEKMTPESKEGQLVAEMVEETKRLQDLFFDALKDIAEAGVMVQEGVTGTDVKMSYNGIREGLAKNALDKLSEKLGDRFPLSRNFEKVILADDTPLVINDVQKGAIKRQSNSKNRIESFYATGKRAFQNSYGIKTEVNIKQLGIKATLHQSVVSESLSKVINSKALKANDGKGENEQNLIDLIPHLKNILENSILLSVERVQHTDNKKTSLYEYRLYNVYKYIENDVEQKRCIVTTITQNLYDSDTYAYRSIENVITERSLPTGNGDMSTSLNDDIYTISQLYGFVKKIKRENGGIKYSPTERTRFLFSYDRRKDGTLYSDRASSRSMLASALEQFVQSEEEHVLLNDYISNIDKMEADERRLAELREEINDMQYTKGRRNTEFLDNLEKKREEARKITARLTRYDESILRMESTQVLRSLISRERTAAARLQKQKNAKAKERAARRREIVETRRKTLNIAHGIESLLSRETKNRNIKDGMKDVGKKLLSLSKFLFEDVADNADIARMGIEGLDEDEKRMVARYVELSDRRDALKEEEKKIRKDDSVSREIRNERLESFRNKHRAEREAISQEISRFNNVELKEIFARERRILISMILFIIAFSIISPES